MSILLSGKEIINMAVEVEKSGRAFYETITASAPSGELKDLFAYLAEQEVQHQKYFESLEDEFDDFEIDQDNWEEISEYIKATSDSRFFIGEDKAVHAARNTKDLLDAIDVAIGFEKDTLLFFHELIDITPARSKESARKIAEEEKKHIRILSEMKKKHS